MRLDCLCAFVYPCIKTQSDIMRRLDEVVIDRLDQFLQCFWMMGNFVQTLPRIRSIFFLTSE